MLTIVGIVALTFTLIVCVLVAWAQDQEICPGRWSYTFGRWYCTGCDKSDGSPISTPPGVHHRPRATANR